MSIASEIARISTNISDSLDAVALKGVTVPSGSNSDDLPGLIALIPTGGGTGMVVVETEDSHGGTIVSITGEEVRLQSKTATPTTSSQTISPDQDYTGLSQVLVNPIPSQYIVPTGNKAITENGTGIDVAQYATVSVSVSGGAAVLQDKSVSPTESQQTVTADSGYDGLGTVTVGAISSTYVGSGITRKSSSDLTASGATVSVPAGYYESNASKSVASGSATAPASISGTSATVSTGTNTLTLTKTVSVTPSVTAGYVSSGTAGNSSVSLTASVTTQAAQTIYPSTSDQTIASGRYLTGTQTIKSVTTTNLSASNILSGVTIKVGDSADDDRIASVTGSVTFQTYYTGSSAPSSSTGVDGDIYLVVT